MSVPTLREQLMVSYLEGHDPDVGDLHEIVSFNDDEIDALFRIYDAVVVHDGCVDSDDAVRLALYLFNGGPNSQPLRAVDSLTTVSNVPIPMTDRCVICQCDMDGNGHQSQLTKGGKTLQHSYCMDCWDDISQIVRGAESDEESRFDVEEEPMFGSFFQNDGKGKPQDEEKPHGDLRRFNGRPKGIIEEEPRAECRSSCCGTLGARTREGSCRGCRGMSTKDLHTLRKTNGWEE
jgi:hypothetical protein